MTKKGKLTLLFVLYLAQGLPYGFFTQALPVLLRSSGLSLPQIGATSLLTLPWALKFLWAPAVDRWRFSRLGLRKSWLVPIQLASILLYVALGMSGLSADKLSLILIAFLFSNFLAASQDVAADGLAVDIFKPADRGWANSIQVGGYRAGMIVGGLVLLAYFPSLGWSGVMYAMAGLAIFCTLPVLFYKEALVRERAPLINTPFKETIRFFLNPGALKWGSVLLCFKFGHAAASAMMRPWLVDQSYSLTEIAKILGIGGFVAGFLGALCGGWIASRGARARWLVALGFLQVIGLSSYLWPVLTSHSAYKVVVAAALDNFTSGLATTVLFTLMMDACSRVRAASDYTLQACTVVISQSLASAFAGFAADGMGYPWFFGVAGVMGLLGLVLTAIILRDRDVRELLNPLKHANPLKQAGPF